MATLVIGTPKQLKADGNPVRYATITWSVEPASSLNLHDDGQAGTDADGLIAGDFLLTVSREDGRSGTLSGTITDEPLVLTLEDI